MAQRDRLSSLILTHWRRYHPKMLAELQRQNRLQQTLDETAERFADLMYDMVSVRKMDYHVAWEMAMSEWALLPSQSHLRSSPTGSTPTIRQPRQPVTFG